VHLPARSRLSLAPALVCTKVHTKGVVVVKLTVNPDEALARTVIVEPAGAWLGSGANLIVWPALDTVKLRLTGGAGA